MHGIPTELLSIVIKIIVRPIPVPSSATRCRCNSASTKITGVLLDVRRPHPIQHGENKQVQRQAIHRKQVPARSCLQHQPRDLEDGPFGQTHPFQRTCAFSAAEGCKWRDVAFVR